MLSLFVPFYLRFVCLIYSLINRLRLMNEVKYSSVDVFCFKGWSTNVRARSAFRLKRGQRCGVGCVSLAKRPQHRAAAPKFNGATCVEQGGIIIHRLGDGPRTLCRINTFLEIRIPSFTSLEPLSIIKP